MKENWGFALMDVLSDFVWFMRLDIRIARFFCFLLCHPAWTYRKKELIFWNWHRLLLSEFYLVSQRMYEESRNQSDLC